AGNRAGAAYPNGTTGSWAFDALNRTTGVQYLRPDASVLASFTYTLDAAGNRRSDVDASGRQSSYTYDANDALTSETVSTSTASHSTTYVYDAAGSRSSRTTSAGTQIYSYDANDRLLGDGVNTFGYDFNGNITSETNASGTTTFGYDFENR